MTFFNLNRRGLIAACAAIWSATLGVPSAQADAADTLSIGGTVTEIVYALGQGHRLRARDTTSVYPPEATELPDVGYIRALSPEGVLSVGASLIISDEGARPVEAVDVIRAADVNFVEVPQGYTIEALSRKIRIIGEALDVDATAETLISDVTKDIEEATAVAQASIDEPKRVMFLLSARGGKLMAAGRGTGPDAIIRLAGGINAVNAFEGYKPIASEATLAAAPDLILMMRRGGDHGANADELFKIPALALTPAAKTRALETMEPLLVTGFGPRTGEAVRHLSQILYGN